MTTNGTATQDEIMGIVDKWEAEDNVEALQRLLLFVLKLHEANGTATFRDQALIAVLEEQLRGTGSPMSAQADKKTAKLVSMMGVPITPTSWELACRLRILSQSDEAKRKRVLAKISRALDALETSRATDC